MAVMNAIVANREADDTTVWLALSHIQYLTIVAYEVRNFLAKNATPISAGDRWVHEASLAASRHSTKLFNDTKRTRLELLSAFTAGAVRDRRWYLRNNRAPWFVRTLAAAGLPINDTSVLMYDDQFLCSSHSIAFHAQLDPESDRADIQDRARELASYISAFPDASNPAWSGDDYFRGWRSDRVQPKDAQYSRLYAAMFPSVPLAEAMALAILRSSVASLSLMREMVPTSNPLAPTTFKFRFAGVWQIVETLRTIAAPSSALDLPEPMRDDIRRLLGDERLDPMTTPGARSLRNVLVHYGLGAIDPDVLNWDDPLLGLTEHLLGGASWVATDQMLDQQIGALLHLLESWSGPFSGVLNDPPE